MISAPQGDDAGRPAVPFAYFWGDDVLGLRRAAERFAAGVAAPDPATIWRTPTGGPASSVIDELAMRLGTGSLFGTGVVAVVAEPLTLMRARADQERVRALLDRVAPGNAVAFTELTASGARDAAASSALVRQAIQDAGGVVRRVAAPRAGQLEGWIGARATEIGMRMDREAIRALAERVGGSVREGDVDRRRQTEIAESELQLLALYRLDAPVRRVDVEALVDAAIPASAWAFLDAVATRQARRAGSLASRLLAEGAPLPVVVTQLHRRIRQLLEIRDRLADGATPADLVRLLRLNPYRAEILVGQARAWEPAELEAALDALLDVDLASKGTAADGRGSAAGMTGPLALGLWLAEQLPPG